VIPSNITKYAVWLPHEHYSMEVTKSDLKLFSFHPQKKLYGSNYLHSHQFPGPHFQIITQDQKMVPRIQDITDFFIYFFEVKR